MKGSENEKEKREDPSSFVKTRKNEPFDNSFTKMADQVFNQAIPPKQALGVTNREAENIYAQAYRLYNTGKYAEAAHLFRILIMLNAMEHKYMLGLAASLHMMKDYVSAIETYTMCSALDPRNPIPHYHSSDCYLQIKETLSAMLCLELAIESCENKPSYSKIKERAQLSLDSLKQLAC
ncbi:MAG: SycD/LcrH family type III secretion system chaperone [Parachlamydiaceae bacterium]